jgi:hypothetical protein
MTQAANSLDRYQVSAACARIAQRVEYGDSSAE